MSRPTKHDWLFTIDELPQPALVQRNTFENIKETVEEIQEYAVRGTRCVDDTLDIWIEHGEILVAAFGTGEVPRLTTTVLSVCTVPVWNAPVLSYTPIDIVIKDGMVQQIITRPSATIDTAEAC
jgi:hypothetical protein